MPTFSTNELDAASRDYLIAARDSQGEKVPGYFVPRSSFATLWYLIGGFGVLFLTLLIWLPPVGDPTRETMLALAGLLLGGWLVVAGVRSMLFRGSGNDLGRFLLVDAATIWEASGDQVVVTPLEKLQSVDATHHNDEGKSTHTTIEFTFEDGRSKVLTIHDPTQAEQLLAFVETLINLRSSNEDPLPPNVAGLVARQYVLTGQFPERIHPEDVAFETIPQPQRQSPSAAFPWSYAVILGLIVVGLIGLRPVNASLRDDALYERATQAPVKAPLLRGYLIDPRNQKHRAAVQAKLDQIYNERITIMKNLPNAKRDPGALDGLCAALESLKTKDIPIVTIRVKADSAVNTLNLAQQQDIHKNLTVSLAQRLSRTLGEELAAYAEPTDPDQPAMIEAEYDLTNDVRFSTVVVKVIMRINEKLYRAEPHRCAVLGGQPADLQRAIEACLDRFLKPMESGGDGLGPAGQF